MKEFLQEQIKPISIVIARKIHWSCLVNNDSVNNGSVTSGSSVKMKKRTTLKRRATAAANNTDTPNVAFKAKTALVRKPTRSRTKVTPIGSHESSLMVVPIQHSQQQFQKKGVNGYVSTAPPSLNQMRNAMLSFYTEQAPQKLSDPAFIDKLIAYYQDQHGAVDFWPQLCSTCQQTYNKDLNQYLRAAAVVQNEEPDALFKNFKRPKSWLYIFFLVTIVPGPLLVATLGLSACGLVIALVAKSTGPLACGLILCDFWVLISYSNVRNSFIAFHLSLGTLLATVSWSYRYLMWIHILSFLLVLLFGAISGSCRGK